MVNSCFVKNIFQDRVDEETHRQFVRFGKGNFATRAVLSLKKNNKIKVKGSFEYANDFVLLVSEFSAKFSGVVLSKEDISDVFIDNKVDVDKSKKSGLFVYILKDISSSVIKDISDKVYAMLLDAEGQGISLKMKKKLPKPGKSGEGKTDDKFCQLEADAKYGNAIKEAFFWDVPDCKKARIEHVYNIVEIILPKGEKDFEKIRVLAKRKGKIIRKIEFDGKSMEKSKEMEV